MTYYIILHTDILLFKVFRIDNLDLVLLKSSDKKFQYQNPPSIATSVKVFRRYPLLTFQFISNLNFFFFFLSQRQCIVSSLASLIVQSKSSSENYTFKIPFFYFLHWRMF